MIVKLVLVVLQLSTSCQIKALNTFNECADKVFVLYINTQLQSCTRVDILWDSYLSDSFKDPNQEVICREKSSSTKVLATGPKEQKRALHISYIFLSSPFHTANEVVAWPLVTTQLL